MRFARAAGRQPVSASRMRGGLANTLIGVECVDGPIVVRLLTRSPRSVETEAAVMARASAVVPVPDVLAVDPNGEQCGCPGIAMSYAEGITARTAFRRDSASGRHEIMRACTKTIAALAAVDLGVAGALVTPDLVPEPASASDLPTRYHEALRRSAVAARALGPDAGWQQLAERFPRGAATYEADHHLVHGDANLSNFVLARNEGHWKVVAVVDWEIAFSGSIVFDLASLLRGHQRDRAVISAIEQGLHDGGLTAPDGWVELAAALDEHQLTELLGPAEPILPRPLLKLLRIPLRAGVLK